MPYSKNDNPLVDRRIILTSTNPRAHEIWDRFWQDEVPDHEKAVYLPKAEWINPPSTENIGA